MTDRIKELARTAHDAALKEYRLRMETELAGDVIFHDIYDRKLAEMVALECVAVCDSYGMPDGTSSAAKIISTVIKSKFGVE